METLGPHQILIADPTATRAALAELMIGWGLQVTIAKNGSEAIELTKEKLYDLILIAVQLDGIDGYETTRIIRRLGDQFQTVPIIGYGDIIADKKEHELTDLILNPLDQPELHKTLKNYLGKGQPEIVLANLDRCTDGDAEFRRELALLLANNVTELMTNIEKARLAGDPQIFSRAVHKTKTTLSILNDEGLNETISSLQTKLEEPASDDLDRLIEKMMVQCRRILGILQNLSTQ